MSRLEDDRAKLEEAVALFRSQAALHGSSSASALIRWAHQGGKKKPAASMVRDAWHDFEAGRGYAELPVERYVVEYHRQEELFQGGDSAPKSVSGGPPTEAETAESPPVKDPETGEWVSEVELRRRQDGCEHKVRVNSGRSVVCDGCGEVLEELPECSHEGTTKRGHDDPNRWVCTACGEDVGEAPPEIKKPKPTKPAAVDDDQEVLF